MSKKLLFIALAMLVLLAACAAPAPTATPVPPAPTAVPPTAVKPTTAPVNEFAVMAEAADKYLASGKAFVTAVDKLYETLNDGDAANDPFILDIRSAADFAKGSIKGSVNVPFAQVFKAENLAKLPKDKPIVVVCYTGHTASMTSFALSSMGYNASALKFSMMAWTKDDAPIGTVKRFPAEQKDFAVDKVAAALPAAGKSPTVSTGKTAVADMIAIQADKYLASGKAPTILAEKVFEALNDGDPANDPFVLDIRGAADYEKGHVKGAVNVPFAQAFKAENLAKYPMDKQIVTVCYTGHTASMTSFYLNALGYNAASVKWGIMGWSKDDALIGSNKRYPADQKDYPVVKAP